MTEHEYMASDDPAAMLAEVSIDRPHTRPLNGRMISDRKLRLFAVGCCRLVWDGTPCERCNGKGWHDTEPGDGEMNCFACNGTGKVGGLTDPRSRRAVEVAEAFADGLATEQELRAAILQASDAHGDLLRAGAEQHRRLPAHVAQWVAPINGLTVADSIGIMLPWFDGQAAAQAALLRQIVGNPWRRIRIKRKDEPHFGWDIHPEYLTPAVLDLAAKAYGEECRCAKCDGEGTLIGDPGCHYCEGDGRVEDPDSEYVDGTMDCEWCDRIDCPECGGSGKRCTPFDATALRPLSDALVEAGCQEEAMLRALRGEESCAPCEILMVDSSDLRASLKASGVSIRTVAPGIVAKQAAHLPNCRHCAGSGWRPSPVAACRGMWVLDVILGKE